MTRTVATRWTAVASVLVVAAVAAVVSYSHMSHLADQSGEQWRSYLIPLSVDGMLVASTLAIVDRRRADLPAGCVPWLGLSLGILASLAANVAAARPDPIARIIAAWPPVAFAVAVETLVIVLRGTSATSNSELDVAPTVSPSGEGSDRPEPTTEVGGPPAPASVVAPKSSSVPQGADSSTKSPGAIRAQRARQHKAGDHSMCLAGNCPHVPNPQVNGAKVAVPA